jgi:NADH-quinone oxidoreductase subunit J
MTSIPFLLAVACTLLSAVAVVRARNLIHAVLWLGLTLLATAVLYAMIGASFLAGLQALLYVGGVVTLMIFGVMLTRRHEGLEAPAESAGSGRAAFVALGLFGVVTWAIHATPTLDGLGAPVASLPTAELGRALVHDHVLAFEVLSILLLAAILGAVVIARRRDPGEGRQGARRDVPVPRPSDQGART